MIGGVSATRTSSGVGSTSIVYIFAKITIPFIGINL